MTKYRIQYCFRVILLCFISGLMDEPLGRRRYGSPTRLNTIPPPPAGLGASGFKNTLWHKTSQIQGGCSQLSGATYTYLE